MGVFVHRLIIIIPGLNARGLQSKLLITPLSECSHNIILQVWCRPCVYDTMTGMLKISLAVANNSVPMTGLTPYIIIVYI